MNAHLAYESNRAYVFQDYYWKPEYFPWQPAGFPWPQTPLNALISGPTAGGLWDPGDTAPRSISERWFDIVCPKSERRIIDTQDVKPPVYWDMGDVIFDHWVKLLRDAPERCIEIVPTASRADDGFPQTFDLWLWGSYRILPLWDRFRNSPTSRLLGPSTLVRSAVSRNELLFIPRTDGSSRDPYERMMAVHVRRGDYNAQCLSLANWNSTYYSWNLLDILPDKFIPPPGGTPGENTPENIEMYMSHCLPTLNEIALTISNARDAYINHAPSLNRTMETIYILTNDRSEWLTSLKETLQRTGWSSVVTSNDLILDQEQLAVSMAVDMDIARRAAVFIGNGVRDLFMIWLMSWLYQMIVVQWSSFTSNIVHQRLVNGKEPISIRFW